MYHSGLLTSIFLLCFLCTCVGMVLAHDGEGTAPAARTNPPPVPAAAMISSAPGEVSAADPFLWLEEVDGARAMEFVTKQNARTLERLRATPDYEQVYRKSLEINNSTDRIAYPRPMGGYVYNFWQDNDHVRGIWRRSTQALYDAGTPAWETLLDLDAMSRADNIRWVFKGASALEPDEQTNPVYDRFLISLSNGGGDATEVREFDLRTKSFTDVRFPASKGSVSYIDANTFLVCRDFGEGSMTTSGYPRQIRIWKRGTPLGSATVIFTGEPGDVSSSAYVLRDVARGTGDKASRVYTILLRGVTSSQARNMCGATTKR